MKWEKTHCQSSVWRACVNTPCAKCLRGLLRIILYLSGFLFDVKIAPMENSSRRMHTGCAIFFSSSDQLGHVLLGLGDLLPSLMEFLWALPKAPITTAAAAPEPIDAASHGATKAHQNRPSAHLNQIHHGSSAYVLVGYGVQLA